MIAKLRKAGTNIVRMNFSHGSYEVISLIFNKINDSTTKASLRILARQKNPSRGVLSPSRLTPKVPKFVLEIPLAMSIFPFLRAMN